MKIEKDYYNINWDLEGFAQKNIEFMLHSWAISDGHSRINISADYQKLDGITQTVSRGLGAFRGDDVLDIGCNSGLHSIVVSSVANSVIGCDQEELFINRAKAAAADLLNKGILLKSLDFQLEDFNNLLSRHFNALIMARILYHVGDAALLNLIEVIKSKIDKVLIQCRPMRDVVYKDEDISVTKLYNGMYKVEDCIDFLVDCNFNDFKVWGESPLWQGGESFPVIYSSRI